MDGLGLAAPTGIGPNGMVQFGQPSNAYVEFYSRAEHNPGKSEKEGRPVYDAVDFVKVIHPGERDVIERAVKEEDRFRWPQQWMQYQAKQEQAPEGTPIEHLFPQNTEIVATLRHMKFHTVELLANASDSALQGIGMGGRQWHEKAKKFLESANKAVGFHKLQTELADRDTKIANLTDVIAKMEAKIAKLERKEK
jgi:hypothetical protein